MAGLLPGEVSPNHELSPPPPPFEGEENGAANARGPLERVTTLGEALAARGLLLFVVVEDVGATAMAPLLLLLLFILPGWVSRLQLSELTTLVRGTWAVELELGDRPSPPPLRGETESFTCTSV